MRHPCPRSVPSNPPELTNSAEACGLARLPDTGFAFLCWQIDNASFSARSGGVLAKASRAGSTSRPPIFDLDKKRACLLDAPAFG